MDLYLIAVVVYVLVLLGIGLYKSRVVKTQDDFMVAGRKTSTWFLVMTLVVTWIGSGSLFGGAGLAFRTGLSALWFSAGAWVGIVVIYFLAHRVRRISQYTLSDLLEKRYNAAARLLGTSAIIIAYITIAGYQFRGGGRLLNILTGLDPVVGGAIVCGVVILFTLTAGMVSIITVDMLNGLMMSFGLLLALPLVLSAVGGVDAVAQLPPEHFKVFGQHHPLWAVGLFLPTFFLLLSESSIYQKFFSAKDEHAARKGVIGMVIGVVILETVLALTAMIGGAKYLTLAPFANADGSLNKAATETILLHLARFDIPVFAGILLICAAVAIILSTANSFLVIASTNVTRDIYQRFINPDASQERIVFFQRIWIVIIGIVAFIAAGFFTSILDMAFTAYAIVGAGITPPLLAAFLWKRVTPQGGVASLIGATVTTIGITAVNKILAEPLLETDYIIIPAASVSIILLIVVSLMTPPSPEEKWKPFIQR